jgi:hypothetical protein
MWKHGQSVRRLFLAAVLALISAQTWAQKELTGGIWKCTGQNGNIRYTNIQSETAGCQLVVDHWIAFSNQGKKRWYLGDDSLVRAGPHWEIWEMWNYLEKQKMELYPFAAYRSIVSLTRHNCMERTGALVQAIFYSEELGKGEPVYSWGVSPEKAVFVAAIPDSSDEKLMDYVCRTAGTKKTEQRVN